MVAFSDPRHIGHRFLLTSTPSSLKWAVFAGIAQLVEHDLAKVGVASSSLVSRSKTSITHPVRDPSNKGLHGPFLLRQITQTHPRRSIGVRSHTHRRAACLLSFAAVCRYSRSRIASWRARPIRMHGVVVVALLKRRASVRRPTWCAPSTRGLGANGYRAGAIAVHDLLASEGAKHKPVVLAGAMRPATALAADGSMNIFLQTLFDRY